MSRLIIAVTFISWASVSEGQTPRVVLTPDGKGRITTYAKKLSPADAAAVLSRPATVADLSPSTTSPELIPVWTSTTSNPGDGPFGPFPPPEILRPLNCCEKYVIRLPRLDGHGGRAPVRGVHPR
jgi:hypothetical protein